MDSDKMANEHKAVYVRSLKDSVYQLCVTEVVGLGEFWNTRCDWLRTVTDVTSRPRFHAIQ